MQLTVYGGAGMIGGNKILLESGGASLFFDFGISYAIWSSYFEEYLKPRPARGIVDLFALGLLPPLEGIYRKDYFPSYINQRELFSNHPAYRKLELSGVLLSHAHLDHSGHLSFIKEDIPIYSSALTAAISKAVQDTSIPDFEKEVCYKIPKEEDQRGFLKSSDYKKIPAVSRPFFLVNSKLPDFLQKFWCSLTAARHLDSKPLQESSSAAGMEIKRFTVDHSIFGSSAFAVRTPEGWVVYTGDMRLGGKKGQLTRSFAEEARKLNPVALITEGTRIYEKTESVDACAEAYTDEDEVFEKCLEAVRKAKGLVIADFGPRNLERLLAFLEVARRVGRKLAVLAKDAYLLEQVHAAIPEEVPHPLREDAVVVYRDVKSSQKGWETQLLARYQKKLTTGLEIRKSQKDYIVCMSFLDIHELIDICPDEGVYIYSSSEAYTEEQRIDFRRLRNWLSLFHLSPLGLPDSETGKAKPEEQGYHVSGHMNASEILEIIRTIHPQIVIPVHTLHPEFFASALKKENYDVRIPNPLCAAPIAIA